MSGAWPATRINSPSDSPPSAPAMLRICSVRRSGELGPIHSRQRTNSRADERLALLTNTQVLGSCSTSISPAAADAGKSTKTNRYRCSNFSNEQRNGVFISRQCSRPRVEDSPAHRDVGSHGAFRARGRVCRRDRVFRTLRGARGSASHRAGAPRHRLCMSRSTSMTQRCPFSAICQAALAAIVVDPTPPRTPRTKISLPLREPVDLSSYPPFRMLLQIRLTRSRTKGLKKYSVTPAFFR